MDHLHCIIGSASVCPHAVKHLPGIKPFPDAPKRAAGSKSPCVLVKRRGIFVSRRICSAIRGKRSCNEPAIIQFGKAFHLFQIKTHGLGNPSSSNKLSCAPQSCAASPAAFDGFDVNRCFVKQISPIDRQEPCPYRADAAQQKDMFHGDGKIFAIVIDICHKLSYDGYSQMITCIAAV